MEDRGERVDDNTKFNAPILIEIFWDLWERTMILSTRAMLQHGDIAKHNLLLVGKGSNYTTVADRFVLIDWDEARMHPKSKVSCLLYVLQNHQWFLDW